MRSHLRRARRATAELTRIACGPVATGSAVTVLAVVKCVAITLVAHMVGCAVILHAVIQEAQVEVGVVPDVVRQVKSVVIIKTVVTMV